jgi:hypothetical protein
MIVIYILSIRLYNFQITILIIALALNIKAFPFKIGDDWNDLKVTWGIYKIYVYNHHFKIK